METEVFEAQTSVQIQRRERERERTAAAPASPAAKDARLQAQQETWRSKSITVRSVFDRVIVSPSLTIGNRRQRERERGGEIRGKGSEGDD